METTLPKGYCHYFIKNGFCRRGETCRFLHEIPNGFPKPETRKDGAPAVLFPPQQKAQNSHLPKGYCHFYLQKGTCSKGETCRFLHQIPENFDTNMMQNNVKTEDRGNRAQNNLPKGYCHYYIQNGYCRKNDSCRFLHQMPPNYTPAVAQPQQSRSLALPQYPVFGQEPSGDTIEEILECPNFHAKGFCNRFKTCRYYHDGVECDTFIEQGTCPDETCPYYHRSIWERNRKQKVLNNLGKLLKQGANSYGVTLKDIPHLYEKEFGEYLYISLDELSSFLQEINGVTVKKELGKSTVKMKTRRRSASRSNSRSRSRSYSR